MLTLIQFTNNGQMFCSKGDGQSRDQLPGTWIFIRQSSWSRCLWTVILYFLSPFVLHLVLACIYGSSTIQTKKVNGLSLQVRFYWPASPLHMFQVDPKVVITGGRGSKSMHFTYCTSKVLKSKPGHPSDRSPTIPNAFHAHRTSSQGAAALGRFVTSKVFPFILFRSIHLNFVSSNNHPVRHRCIYTGSANFFPFKTFV
jgi:hypothetical protein